MNNILIVEDDSTLANGLCRAFTSDLVCTESAGSIKAARTKLEEKTYSLILLDINLPDGNGFDFLEIIKEKYDTSVIIVTANDMETDIVSGLELGADDYVTKPFSLAVLRARVNNQLRKRAAAEDIQRKSALIYEKNEYIFDFDKMEFYRRNESVELSKTEQKLLRIFVENEGATLKRSYLIDRIWTDGAEYVDENALSVTVKRLRDKLQAQDYIKTVYGIGYTWNID